jgi:hypothetical protein
MEYREIVSVTGIGGLYQLLTTKSDGAIVRNLADNSTKFISARLHNVTPLESIEIYTTGQNVRLHEILQKMKESSTARPDTKKGSNEDIRAYFRNVYPGLDEERVYISDMKKMVKWYDLLETNNLLDFSYMQQQQQEAAAGESEALMGEGEAQLAESAKSGGEPVALVEDAEKPAKKARAKKAAEPVAEGEGQPVKKAARKKKAEEVEGEEQPAKKTAAKKEKEEG